jgi:hypothetical protein
MGLHAAIPLVAALANLVIGAAVLGRGWTDRLARSFAFFSLCLTAWNLGIFALYYFEDPATAEWWSRMCRTGIVLGPAAAFHTVLLLNDRRSRGSSALLGAAYIISAVLAVLNFQGKLVTGVEAHYWGWYPTPSPLYRAVALHILAFGALSIERTFHAYRHPESPRRRAQAKFWFLAFALGATFMVTNVAVMYGAHVYPLGNLGNVIYASIMAYAIVRHRLMDVDYIVRKFVSFTASLSVVMLPGGVGSTSWRVSSVPTSPRSSRSRPSRSGSRASSWSRRSSTRSSIACSRPSSPALRLPATAAALLGPARARLRREGPHPPTRRYALRDPRRGVLPDLPRPRPRGGVRARLSHRATAPSNSRRSSPTPAGG